jgi:hypothetical protein
MRLVQLLLSEAHRESALSILDDGAYDDLELVTTSVEFVVVSGSAPPDVTVVFYRPVDASYPTLASDLAASIREPTDRDVNVRVEFVDVQRFDAAG